MNDILCKCGHLQKAHAFENKTWCSECWYKRWGRWISLDVPRQYKVCTCYVADNLSYLEQLAERRDLI
jgi:hypothetical protein